MKHFASFMGMCEFMAAFFFFYLLYNTYHCSLHNIKATLCWRLCRSILYDGHADGLYQSQGVNYVV